MSSRKLEVGREIHQVEEHDRLSKEVIINFETVDEQTARYTAALPLEINAATKKRLSRL
jgi:hypothetical protein